MLNRKHLVPEVQENTDIDASDDSISPVDACLDRLETLRSEISHPSTNTDAPSIELQLESLFSGSSRRVVTEMERIAIILCRIAHRIIRSDSLSETDYSILLQIFELGLFLGQFKDRWLSHLDSSQALSENKWEPVKDYAAPSQLFPPARELVSLAQEYILRQNILTGNRCDLCAYALANINGIYAPSVSLLMKQQIRPSASNDKTELDSEQLDGLENTEEPALPLNYFYFLLYALSKSSAEKAKIFTHWVQESPGELEGDIFYLPNIDEKKYFAAEIRKIRDTDAAIEIVRASSSHFLFYHAQAIIQAHRRNKITTKALSEIVVSTYHKENVEHTVQILQNISKYNPVASESLTKSLIIMGEAVELAEYFFKTAFIIDRDYAESCLLCIGRISCIPRGTLNLLCGSDYFGVLCAEKGTFTQVVKTVVEMHCKETGEVQGNETVTRSPWNIRLFCRRAIQAQNISLESLERGLILMMYFPSESNTVKQTTWDMIESKGMQSVVKAVEGALAALSLTKSPYAPSNEGAPERSERIEHILDILNHYREIPAVQKQLLRISKRTGLLPVLAKYDPDLFSIKCIRREIDRLKSDIKGLHEFLMQLKTRDELRYDSFWFAQARKNISLGSTIRSLNSVMLQDDMLYLLNNEEDIVYLLRLVTRRPIPDTLLASSLVEKLDGETENEEGLILGENSLISASVPNKPLTVYAILIQKEFTGRQSIIRAISSDSEIEVFIRDGILLFRWQGASKEKKDAIEERECRINYAFSSSSLNNEESGKLSQNRDSQKSEKRSGRGWNVSIAVSVGSKECQIKIEDFSVSMPYGLKASSVVIGEEFKGVLKRALILEEGYKKGRLSSRPSEEYYIDNLVAIEKSCQYYGKFGLLIDSTVPYTIHGLSKVRMVNVFKSAGSQWRKSERLCRYIAKLSSKHYQIEEALHSHILPSEPLPDYLIR
ncbi:hypothetical protein NEMIN01_2236 [Nematocida minor]|uniref:uncharacterized protein n=1 Tax=Nematocida minor TaxID=1912983 RepID=UPI00221F669F|nr:uncharacterized protein NEMIN01_2236 [Nematocida minor]KAI5192820.1 hypothetical protein NEMIN01_2236 [Nematocida minor]